MSYTRKHLALWIIFISVDFACKAQKDLENGYIIRNDGSQAYGLIDVKSNISNSKACIFHEPEKGTLESFSPGEIKGYKTTTKYYISKEVAIDSVKQTLFLEYLVDGIVDLYYLRDPLNEYYFVEKDGQLVHLENNKTRILISGDGMHANDRTYIKESNQYKGALNYLFNEGEGLSKKIDDTPFYYRSLINLTKDYHNKVCNEYECIDYTRPTHQNIFFEISGGLLISDFTLKTSNDVLYNIRPGVTVQARFNPLKSKTHWIFLIGLGYSSNDFHGRFENDLFYFSNRDTLDLTEKYSIVRLPLNVQYEFSSGKIQPFLSFGYTACFYIGADYAAYGTARGRLFPERSSLRRWQHGFTGGTGLNLKLKNEKYIFIKASYEYRIPSVNLKHVFDYVRHNTYMLNFGYAFGI